MASAGHMPLVSVASTLHCSGAEAIRLVACCDGCRDSDNVTVELFAGFSGHGVTDKDSYDI